MLYKGNSYNGVKIDWIKTEPEAWDPVKALLQKSSIEAVVV